MVFDDCCSIRRYYIVQITKTIASQQAVLLADQNCTFFLAGPKTGADNLTLRSKLVSSCVYLERYLGFALPVIKFL